MSMTEINQLDVELDPENRFARFSAASNDYYYLFETLTEKEGFRSNWNKLEGDDLQVG